jgi:hypothetical protein
LQAAVRSLAAERAQLLAQQHDLAGILFQLGAGIGTAGARLVAFDLAVQTGLDAVGGDGLQIAALLYRALQDVLYRILRRQLAVDRDDRGRECQACFLLAGLGRLLAGDGLLQGRLVLVPEVKLIADVQASLFSLYQLPP